jgi:putative endonuclease
MYILKCSDDSFYVGSTWDLERRLRQHNAGIGGKYTSEHLPVVLMYYEWDDRIDHAYYRERQIHNWFHNKKAALISGDFGSLKSLAKKKFIHKR